MPDCTLYPFTLVPFVLVTDGLLSVVRNVPDHLLDFNISLTHHFYSSDGHSYLLGASNSS